VSLAATKSLGSGGLVPLLVERAENDTHSALDMMKAPGGDIRVCGTMLPGSLIVAKNRECANVSYLLVTVPPIFDTS
jgi:hypothetical protein